jgi:hypothetical protein
LRIELGDSLDLTLNGIHSSAPIETRKKGEDSEGHPLFECKVTHGWERQYIVKLQYNDTKSRIT